MSITRYWMTGCMAVVTMVAHQQAQGQRHSAADHAQRRHSVSRASPFPAAATVHRIERAAQDSGLGVFATLDDMTRDGHPEQVLVLADADGVTPIVQDDALRESGFGLPMELRVLELDDGTSVVTMFDSDHWPPSLADQVSALPRLVDDALGSDRS